MKKILIFIICAMLLATGCASSKETSDAGKESDTMKTTVKVDDIALEAEDGVLLGNAKLASGTQGYSGSGYVTDFKDSEDGVELSVTIPYGCHYDLHFFINSNGVYKENKIFVDGKKAANVSTESDGFSECIVEKIWLDEGEHKISLKKGWGWIDFDRLVIKQSEVLGSDIYDLPAVLCNPNATKEAKNLYNYLMSIYGKYTLAGQHSTPGMNSEEFDSVKAKTGKLPALIEIDIMKLTAEYSTEYMSIDEYVSRVKEFDKKGGIVVINWHWFAPKKYLLDSTEQPWWRGFYKEATNISLESIMNGEDSEGYELLIKDIDIMAEFFGKLQDANIPVLFRPLHEAGGGWFWWGAEGAEPYKQLYTTLYDRLVNYHKLNNIIWVWNGDDTEWYPGDEYVDIASTDRYADSGDHSTQINDFIAVYKACGGNKPVALAENGVQVDPELMERDNVHWLYFCTWGGEYCTTDQYTSDEMFKKVFNSEKVITLDELPKWKKGKLK